MDIKAVLNNIRKKGIRGTLELRKRRKNERENKAVLREALDRILIETRDDELFLGIKEYYEKIYIPALYKDMSYIDADRSKVVFLAGKGHENKASETYSHIKNQKGIKAEYFQLDSDVYLSEPYGSRVSNAVISAAGAGTIVICGDIAFADDIVYRKETTVIDDMYRAGHSGSDAELIAGLAVPVTDASSGERPSVVFPDGMKKKDFIEAEHMKLFPKELNGPLKKYYIKRFLPAVYEHFRKDPVEENKVIILQQRSSLNSSCKSIYHSLKDDPYFNVIFHELRSKKVSAVRYYQNAALFVADFATARAVITHEQSEILGSIDIRPESLFIQLWHGLPLKKLRLSIAGMPGYKSLKGFEEYPESNYDIVTIAAPEWRPVFEEFMGLEKDTPVIQSLGIPRTDQFYDKEYIDRCYEKLHSRIPASTEKKVILYAPTYRGLEPNRVAPDEIDIGMFAEKLSDDYILIIKHHQTLSTWPEIPQQYRDSFAYDMTKGSGMDINELMTVSDICITDYSSLVFDFAIYERPVVFFAYDEDEYCDERGFYYTVGELGAGPVCRTNREVVDYIADIDNRFDAGDMKKFKERFIRDCDGHATERIIKIIKEK